MITNFKLFENNGNKYLLCVKSTDKDFYWKFTEGKKYKLYFSSLGIRTKDDNNSFWNIPMISNTHSINKSNLKNNIIEFEYADGIFTTDKSIEDYQIRKNIEKYNL